VWRISVSETTLCCVWHIAFSLELDQLVITRGAELHNEGSAAPSTKQGNPMVLTSSFLTISKVILSKLLLRNIRDSMGDYASMVFSSSNHVCLSVKQDSYYNLTLLLLLKLAYAYQSLSIATFMRSLIILWEKLGEGFRFCKISSHQQVTYFCYLIHMYMLFQIMSYFLTIYVL